MLLLVLILEELEVLVVVVVVLPVLIAFVFKRWEAEEKRGLGQGCDREENQWKTVRLKRDQ